MIFKANINPGEDIQFVIGDIRKDAFVTGTYFVIRGSLRQAGPIDVIATGDYNIPYIGPNCGVDITGHLAGYKILLKVIADSSDTSLTVFECNLKQIKS